jgi:LacI family transcriptional regulator, galactose operon repressor
MKDVAAEAGVDTSLVSRLLNADQTLSVRPETEERVMAAVRRLAYRPNTAARTLKTARTMALGMVIPDLSNVIYAEIARGAGDRAAAAGYVLLISGAAAEVRTEILEDRVDGLLYAVATAQSVPDLDVPGAPPGILINRRGPASSPSVVVDDRAGVALATRYLLSLEHSRIAHVAGPQDVDTARRRRRGYVDAMTAAGLDVPAELTVESTFDEEGGAASTAALLRVTPRPTAIVAANSNAAVGAMAAVREAGLSVPQDVSVVGLHDIPHASYLNPALTTVRMPLAEMGGRAVDLLLGMIAGDPGGAVMVTTPPELIVRASCGPPAGR